MSSSILYASSLITKISTSIFTGSALYCSLVEHPSRMNCSTKIAVNEFRPSFKRAAKLQSTCVLFASLSTSITCYFKMNKKILITCLLMSSVIPYTLICLMPINKRLLDSNLDDESNEAKLLLNKWGQLHWVRSILGLISLLLINID